MVTPYNRFVDEDDDTPELAAKEKRMTTNKVGRNIDSAYWKLAHLPYQRKAKNFYSDANVKNKNRSKAKTMKSLPVGKKAKR